ncbi:hypothetical protein DSECCO2_260760 [anaerobic digester metagenome]|nr:methylamine methyltransferase corrinoid protein reductive activase [Methanomassiliicoccales archaeon]
MDEVGIALDIGTSGFRAQAIDLRTGDVISTAITVRHPIPGSNVIDHVNFAIEAGESECNRLMVGTINRLVRMLRVPRSHFTRMAVCGNPFQLSLFQNIEIRDLAYAGQNKLRSLGVVPPKRDGSIVTAGELGLDIDPLAEVIIPPAVTHEIGADAMAMLWVTGAYTATSPTVIIDYGTNAEMSLICSGRILTGSAAAGPALEGQEIEHGMLASEGAISDIAQEGEGWRSFVLDNEFKVVKGDLVDPVNGTLLDRGPAHGRAIGITGTGVIAAVQLASRKDLVKFPRILTPDGVIRLQDGIDLCSRDLEEAGKAIGAIRAGYMTLAYEAGISPNDIKVAYMSGASGTYVDARKAQGIGLAPFSATEIHQVGNTSLALAKDLVAHPQLYDRLRIFSKALRADHCMFATSEAFKAIYTIELSHWCYGMPMEMYNEMLAMASLSPVDLQARNSVIHQDVVRDIPDLGRLGIQVIQDVGVRLHCELPGCINCQKCVESCPENALVITGSESAKLAEIRSDLCNGTACRRCEQACPEGVMRVKRYRYR